MSIPTPAEPDFILIAETLHLSSGSVISTREAEADDIDVAFMVWVDAVVRVNSTADRKSARIFFTSPADAVSFGVNLIQAAYRPGS